MAAGTEGANSVLKLLQYAKEAVKLRTPERGAQDSPVRRDLAAGAPALLDHREVAADRETTPNSRDDVEAEDPEGAALHDDVHLDRESSRAAPRPWRAAECLLKLRAQVNQIAPTRNKTNDGFIGDADHQSRNSDHNPW
jgi:hypothetical protein